MKTVITEAFQLAREKERARELFDLLLGNNIEQAVNCRTDEKFVMGFSFTFERNAHGTDITGKVTYSKKFTETIEGVAINALQCEMEILGRRDESDSGS